uniref:Gamma-glutamylcyclotransferase family protein n=1 Tax=Parascaris univalens TaxID=6257 RepID=A0A915C0B0_PARUN
MSMAMKNALNKTVERFINSSVTSANTFIFVYGTLKRNEPNYEIMTNISTGKCHLIGCGRTVERFPLLIASKFNIPFCLQQPGIGYRIHGEVYEVDEAKMNALDEFEAHPHFYKRQLQQIEMDSGELLMAWIYLLSSWKPELVQEGSEFMENYSSKGSHGRPYVSSENCEREEDLWN